MADKQIIDAMWDDSPVDVSTEVNFIWSIANKLRGPYRSDKYKDVIIPMTIIRRYYFPHGISPLSAGRIISIFVPFPFSLQMLNL